MSNDLVIAPHPLTLEGRTVTCGLGVLPGESLAAFLTRNGVDISHGDWVVTIGGAAVPRLMWSRTRPRPGMLIECRKVAGKKVLAVIAILVLAYFTMGASLGVTTIGASIAGAYGLGAAAAFAINAGVYMVGSMLINKALGPSSARGNQYDMATPPTYSISGARNRQRPFEPLGLLFGSVRVTPDYAANPYTWFEGEDQLMFMRLQAGVNVGSVGDIKIGDTSITTYSDVTVSRSGFPGSTEKLDDWSNVDSIGGGVLAAATSPGAWVTRTSSANSVRLAVDIGAQLYDMAGDGKFNDATLVLEIERRLLPAGAWGPFDGVSATVSLFSKSTKPVRKTLLSGELTAGQYEVRVRKVTADEATSSKTNSVEWGVLKSYQLDSGSYTDYPQVGIRVRATGQISGSLDAVNWVAQSKAVPVWTGSAWVTQTTSNPGAHILQAARGIFDADGRLQAGMGLPDDQIDIEGLKAFMVHCAAHGYTFDHYFDAPLSCLEMMEAMATAGLGSLSYHPGTLSVVWMTAADPIEGVVAMGNIKAGTFRVDYQTRATADELEVTCYDRDSNWNPTTVRLMAPGVTAPRETARLAPLGNTTQAGLLRSGRLAMGQNIYARKTVSWEMDLEHLTFRRYSVIALSHDLTLWGHSGRLRGAASASGVVTLQLDDMVPANVSAPLRKVGLRVPGENGYRIFDVQPFAGEVTSLVLSTPWPAGVPFPGDSSANPAHDYLWIFDFQATPGQRLRVIAIEPGNDLKGAKISAVPEVDEFWNYLDNGAYVAPPVRPPRPALVVSNVAVQQQRGQVNYDQSTMLSITFDADGPFDHAQVWASLVGTPLELVGETRTRSFGTRPVGNDTSWNIEVRPFDELGRMGTVGAIAHSVALDALASGGAGAPNMNLKYTAFAFLFANASATTSTSPAITFTAELQNVSGVVAFSATAFDAAGAQIGATGAVVLTSVTATTAMLTAANFNALGAATVRYVKVTATLGSLIDYVTVLRGDNGSNALNLIFGNENVTVPTDSAGAGGVFSNANTQWIRLYEGTTDVTSLWTFSRADTNCTSLINGAAGPVSGAGTVNVAVSALAADFGYVAITASRSGFPSQSRNFRLTKSRAGAAGVNGSAIAAVSSAGNVFVSASGGTSYSPAGIIISRNLLGSLIGGGLTTWTVVQGAFTGPLAIVNASTGAPASFGPAAMATDSVTFRCSYIEAGTTYIDDITVTKSRDGLGVYLTNEVAVLPANQAGHITSYANASGVMKVTNGAGDVSGGVAFTCVGFSGFSGAYGSPGPTQDGGNITINAATGAYAVTGDVTDAAIGATVTFRATYTDPLGGSKSFDRVFKVGKALQGTPGINGGAGTRGSVKRYLAGYSAWSSAAATASVPLGVPLLDDEVTEYNGSIFAETRRWDGSAWVLPGTVIPGSLLVQGTVTAAALVANTITAASGVLANAAVTTLTIGNDAVTVPVAVVDTADYALTTSYQQVVTASFVNSVATSGESPRTLLVQASVLLQSTGAATDSETIYLQLFRYFPSLGLEISLGIGEIPVTMRGASLQLETLPVADTATMSAGASYIYRLKVKRAAAPGWSITSLGASLYIMGAKR